MKTEILITGATGFIGKNLVPEIARRRKVRVFTRPTSNIEYLKDLPQVEIVQGNLVENYSLNDALKDIELVIHCAGETRGKNFAAFYRTNTSATKNLLTVMKQKGVKKILFLSSQSAAGPSPDKNPIDESNIPNPISSYGQSKCLAERMIIQSGFEYIILRPVSTYGPYDTDILKYIKLLNKGLGLIVGREEKYFNLIYVMDLVKIILKVIKLDIFNNKIYFINDGNIYSFSQVFSTIAGILKKKIVKIYVPESLSLCFGLFNDALLPGHKKLITYDKVKELTARYWLCKNSLAVRELKFSPEYGLEQGMRLTVEWYQKHNYI